MNFEKQRENRGKRKREGEREEDGSEIKLEIRFKRTGLSKERGRGYKEMGGGENGKRRGGWEIDRVEGCESGGEGKTMGSLDKQCGV
jgi:hypothetical protein